MIVTNKNTVWRVILAVAIALTLLFIWSSSLENAEESSDKSGAVVEVIKPIVDPQDKIEDDLFVSIVRKLAHFSEFALLGFEVYLFCKTFDNRKGSSLPYFVIPIVSSFACAVIDELLQLTSEGRSCEFADMMIDLAGILTGVIISAVLFSFVNRYLKKTR